MNLIFLTSIGGLILLAVILFFYFSTRRNYHKKAKLESEPIKDYEEKRDKLTLREKEEPKDTYDDDSLVSGFSIVNLISGIVVLTIVVLVSFQIMGAMQSTLTEASAASNATTTVALERFSVTSNWLPIIVGIGIAGLVLSLLFRAFNGLGGEGY